MASSLSTGGCLRAHALTAWQIAGGRVVGCVQYCRVRLYLLFSKGIYSKAVFNFSRHNRKKVNQPPTPFPFSLSFLLPSSDVACNCRSSDTQWCNLDQRACVHDLAAITLHTAARSEKSQPFILHRAMLLNFASLGHAMSISSVCIACYRRLAVRQRSVQWWVGEVRHRINRKRWCKTFGGKE